MNISQRQVSLRQSALLTLVGSILQGGTRFLINAIIARVGGPGVLAVTASILSTGQLLSYLWPSSASTAMTAFVSKANASKGGTPPPSAFAAVITRNTLAITTAISVVAAVILLGSGHTGTHVALTTVLFVALALYALSRGWLYGSGRVKRSFIWDAASAATTILSLAFLVLIGVRGPLLIGSFVPGLLIFALANRPPSRSPANPGAIRREVMAFVLTAALGSVAGAGFLQLSMITASTAFSGDTAGEYAAAFILTTPMTLATQAFTQALLPKIAHASSSSREASAAMWVSASNKLAASIACLYIPLCLAAPWITHLLFGPSYEHAHQVVPLLACALFINGAATPSITYLIVSSATGQRTATLWSWVGALSGSTSWIVLVPSLGIRGVAAGYLIGVTILCGGTAHAALKTARAPLVHLAPMGGVAVLTFIVAMATAIVHIPTPMRICLTTLVAILAVMTLARLLHVLPHRR